MGATMRESRYGVVSIALDVGSITANTTIEQDVTVTGLKVGDFVAVCKPSHSTGAGVVNARVKAADTLSLQFLNATGVGIDPASETYLMFWFRPESTPTVVNI